MNTGINDKTRAFANAVGKINTQKLLLLAVKNTADIALDLNKSQMYDKGITSTGRRIGKYSDATVRIKQSKGQPTDRMTLLDTGKFYDKMYVNARAIPILMDSKDAKTPMLEEKYGSDIFGLTPENLQTYREAVAKEYKKLLHAAIESKKEILH